MGIMSESRKLIENGKVKLEGIKEDEIIITSGNYTVKFFKKPGRFLTTCGCQNHSRYSRENPVCKHKASSITLAVMSKLFDENKIKPKDTKLFQESKEIKIGYDHCPIWLKKAYIQAVNNQCQEIINGKRCKGGPLEIHRINPGYKGGEYIPQNIKVLCKDCHKKYNEGW